VRPSVCTPFDKETTETQQMINAAFVGQVQGDIRKIFQILEGFIRMNANQLLYKSFCQLRSGD
jgi:hypothetical protein